LSDASSKLKSFWEKPEGTAGMVTIAVLLGGGFLLVNALLPTLLGFFTLGVAVLGKAIVMTILGAILVGLLYVLTNKRFLTLVSYGFKTFMRHVTNVFVAAFPIDIMKSYIDTLTDKQEMIEDRINKLSGQKRICKNMIDKNAAQVQTSLSTAKVAQAKGMTSQFTLNARVAGRLQKSNMTLQDLWNRMELLYKALTKYKEACSTVVEDLKSEVQVREQEQQMILAAHSAMKAAKAIIQGVSTEKELFDQACEFQAEDYGRKLGEIEDFMNGSKSFIEGLDLQNGVYEEQALKQLEQWEQKADSILLGGEKRIMLEDHTASSPIQLEALQVPQGDYEKFFVTK
jgi:hypothetical protein